MGKTKTKCYLDYGFILHNMHVCVDLYRYDDLSQCEVDVNKPSFDQGGVCDHVIFVIWFN